MNRRLKITLTLSVLGTLASTAVVLAAGYQDKATGEVVVQNVDFPNRLHWFSFAAHEVGDEPEGKGFLSHRRLTPDGAEVRREERAVILYAIVEGSEAWFAGPIFYDSQNPYPTRWFVLHIFDGGKPRDQSDRLNFARVADEEAALQAMMDWYQADRDFTHAVVSGNLKTHER